MRWRGHYEEPMILSGGIWGRGQGPGHRGSCPPATSLALPWCDRYLVLLFSAYVRVHLWGMAYWRCKQHQSTKLSAFVSDRPKIICRHCVDQQFTAFQSHHRQWHHQKVGGQRSSLAPLHRNLGGRPPPLPHSLFHPCCSYTVDICIVFSAVIISLLVFIYSSIWLLDKYTAPEHPNLSLFTLTSQEGLDIRVSPSSSSRAPTAIIGRP